MIFFCIFSITSGCVEITEKSHDIVEKSLNSDAVLVGRI